MWPGPGPGGGGRDPEHELGELQQAVLGAAEDHHRLHLRQDEDQRQPGQGDQAGEAAGKAAVSESAQSAI